jgi:hypothetical protein
MRAISLSTLVGLVTLGSVGCGAVTFGLINQGDRAPGEDLGLRPPQAEAFEPCSHVGNRVERVDTNHDGKIDLVRIATPAGAEVCRGVDANLDGKIDTWDVVKDGRVVERAHDSDGNGKVDQHWVWPVAQRPGCGVMHPDLDGDGRPDPGTPSYDPCGILGGSPVLVPADASLPIGPRRAP